MTLFLIQWNIYRYLFLKTKYTKMFFMFIDILNPHNSWCCFYDRYMRLRIDFIFVFIWKKRIFKYMEIFFPFPTLLLIQLIDFKFIFIPFERVIFNFLSHPGRRFRSSYPAGNVRKSHRIQQESTGSGSNLPMQLNITIDQSVNL